MPSIFLTNHPGIYDDTAKGLTLNYRVIESTYDNQSGWIDISKTETLHFAVPSDYVWDFLNTQYLHDFPLWMNVSSWDIHDSVDIGVHSAEVVDFSNSYGFDCWTCDIDNESTASYANVTGILIHSDWYELNFHRMILLESMGLGSLPQPYIREEGFILTGIFVELAVITGLIAIKLKKSKCHTFRKHI